MHCDKYYGSSAAAIMHMRKKHKEGTKQEIERRRGIRVNDILRNQVTLPQAHYSEEQSKHDSQGGGGGSSSSYHLIESHDPRLPSASGAPSSEHLLLAAATASH